MEDHVEHSPITRADARPRNGVDRRVDAEHVLNAAYLERHVETEQFLVRPVAVSAASRNFASAP
jgi:hypothetical protein